MKDLRNKSRAEIAAILADTQRAQLLEIIFSLASCETMLSVSELAKRRGMSRDTIQRLIRENIITPVHRPSGHDIRIPLSTIADWDNRTRTP